MFVNNQYASQSTSRAVSVLAHKWLDIEPAVSEENARSAVAQI